MSLFKQSRTGYVCFLDQVDCIGYYKNTGEDIKGKQREIIIFELMPKNEILLDFEDEELIKQYSEEKILPF